MQLQGSVIDFLVVSQSIGGLCAGELLVCVRCRQHTADKIELHDMSQLLVLNRRGLDTSVASVEDFCECCEAMEGFNRDAKAQHGLCHQ